VLTTVGSARREYDALAERGEQLISKLRGTSFDEVEDAVEDALQDTPFAKPYDVVEDALEDAGEAVTKLVRSGRSRARGAAAAGRTAGQAAGPCGRRQPPRPAARRGTGRRGAGRRRARRRGRRPAGRRRRPPPLRPPTPRSSRPPARSRSRPPCWRGWTSRPTPRSPALDTGADVDVPDAEAPKGVPTPKATEPDSTRISTAASSEVVEVVERLSANVGGPGAGARRAAAAGLRPHDAGSLRGRMRSLTCRS
jgi:hypothetical protein